MISYKKIGHFGRLGNQMFQFAATVGIARKINQGFAFPKENTEIPSVETLKTELQETFTSIYQNTFPT